MAKKSLNLNIWVTQQALADELDISVQTVHNWVQRNKIEWQLLPGSTTKVINKFSLQINENHHKRKPK